MKSRKPRCRITHGIGVCSYERRVWIPPFVILSLGFLNLSQYGIVEGVL